MKITEIYTTQFEGAVYVEDDSGNLYRWNVNAPGAPLTPTPHKTRVGLTPCEDLWYESYAKSLRAFGHEVAARRRVITKKYLTSASQVMAANWRYQLKAGTDLRNAITDEDPEDVLFALRAAYQELWERGFIDEDDYEQYSAELDDFDTDDEDIESSVNWELDQFYDLCDNLRVWVDGI